MQDSEEYSINYQIGGTTVCIIRPIISEEERKKRLHDIQRQIWFLWIELVRNQGANL